MKLEWEYIDNNTARLNVPGGWIIRSTTGHAVHQIFIEDKEHEWKL